MPCALVAAWPLALDRPWLAIGLLALTVGAVVILARRGRGGVSAARARTALACRILVVALLVLALSGLQWRRERDVLATVFAVDSSDSVRGPAMEQAARWVLESAARARPTDQLAVVQFGRDALVEHGLRHELDELALSSRPRTDGTSLAAALRLSRALLPEDGLRRVVVLTDGAFDDEDPAGAVREAQLAGVDVAFVAVGGERGPEALVEDVVAPEVVHEGEPFEVRVLVRASTATRGRLLVTRDGALLAQEMVELEAGAPAVLRVVDRHGDGGTHVYRAHLAAEADGFTQNDAAEALVRVEGKPAVLVLDPEPARLAPLAALLQAGGVRAEIHGPEHVPPTLARAAEWGAIVLSDVDAVDVSTRQSETLRAFVREAGGGLMMAGGPESFGVGGWYGTAVEEALPVDMDVRSEKYYPSLALVLAIDKSGSMSGADGSSKLDLAKESAALTIGLLQDRDRGGVIGFDSAAKWVVPMSPGSERKAMATQVGTMRSGGGTDIYPAIELAGNTLLAEKTVLKHVVVLSDGQSPGRDYQGLIEGFAAKRITLSTVAVGADADLYTMQRLAEWGRGRYSFTDDPQSLPRIFTKEAFTAGRSFVVEETFKPKPAMAHAVLAGVDAGALPALTGYVATTAKPAAEVALITHREEPLLAMRRFGLGRSAAFTSDLGQRWASSWLGSAGGRTTLAQLVRWLARRQDTKGLRVSLDREAGDLVVSVEARDTDGRFLNMASLEAGIVGPSLQPRDVTLRQVAPGRYEGRLDAPEQGAYFVSVTQREGERIVRAAGAATSLPYSDEYRALESGGALVERLAAASGARVLTEPGDAFTHEGEPVVTLRPAWRELVMLAACLLLIDVAVRRVMLPDGWLAKLTARIPRLRASAPAERSLGLERLRGAKLRQGAPPPTPVVEQPLSAAPPPNVAAPAPVAAPPRAAPRAVAASDEIEPRDGDPASFRDRLLDAKRRARKRS